MKLKFRCQAVCNCGWRTWIQNKPTHVAMAGDFNLPRRPFHRAVWVSCRHDSRHPSRQVSQENKTEASIQVNRLRQWLPLSLNLSLSSNGNRPMWPSQYRIGYTGQPYSTWGLPKDTSTRRPDSLDTTLAAGYQTLHPTSYHL